MKKELKSHAEPALLGFALRTFPAGSRPRIHFRWGRIFLFLFTLMAIAWLTFAGALYMYFKNRLFFDEVTYAKMVALPFRIDAHRKELGDFHISKAKKLLRQKKYREALDFLRAGVARSPGNLEGRRLLSEFFDFGLKQQDDAAEILVQGVAHGGVGNPEYMSTVYRYLLHHEYDDRVIDLGEDLLKEEIELDKVSRLTALATATAYFNLHKFEKAQWHIKEYNLQEVPEGNILSAQVLWEQGEHQAALGILERTSRQFPQAAQVFTRISDYNAEAGDLDKARRNAVLAQVTNPMSLDVALKVLKLEVGLKMTERAKSNFDEILENFGYDLPALLKIASVTAGFGNQEFAKRVHDHARQAGMEDTRFQIAILSAMVIGADFPNASKFGASLLKDADQWRVRYQKGLVLGLLSVAAFGGGDLERGRFFMKEFLQAPLLPPDEIHHLATHFQKTGMLVEQRKILDFGREKHPDYRPILEELLKQDLAQGNYDALPEHLHDVLKVRRKNVQLLRKCQDVLARDRFLFLPERQELMESLENALRSVEAEGGLPPSRI